MSKISSEQLISLIVHKSNLIIIQLDEISLKKFPSDNPLTLINIIKEICAALRDHALQIGEDAASLEEESTENELKLILYKLVEIAPDIRFIEGASVEKTPWSLIQPFENFVCNLHKSIPIILRPQWHYNFTIRRSLLNEYKQSLNNLLKEERFNKIFSADMPAEIYVISFPSFEKLNILLQSILGHELGHPLATEFLNQEDERYLSVIRDMVDKNNILTKTNPLERELERSIIISHIKKLRNDGLSEIISDMVAVNLFSFAVIFAAYEIAIMLSMDDIQGRDYYYPPWRYRIRQMLEQIDWPECDKEMKRVAAKSPDFEAMYTKIAEEIETLQAIVTDKKDLDKIENNKIHKIAYDSIKNVLPSVKKFLASKTEYCMEISIEDIFYLCQRLKFDLPPNALEIESPFNPKIPKMPEIINAGWFYKITYLTDKISLANYEDYTTKLAILNRLIFKALELSDVSLKYRQGMDTSGS